MTYRIDLGEMESHAGRVNEIGGRINTAIGAGSSAENSEAFGLLGIPLAAICFGAQHMAMNVVKEAGQAAKKVVVDGVTGLPKDIGPAMSEEFRKEVAKVWDNGGWLNWRELRQKQEEDEKNS